MICRFYSSVLNKDDIKPLLQHATDEELRLLHQQAKEIRRQRLQEEESQLKGQSLFQVVNLQKFSDNPKKSSVDRFEDDKNQFFTKLFPEEVSLNTKSDSSLTVFSSSDRQVFGDQPRFASSTRSEGIEIHFPSTKLKSTVPVMGLTVIWKGDLQPYKVAAD